MLFAVDFRSRDLAIAAAAGLALLLPGCAVAPAQGSAKDTQTEWHAVRLPGKKPTDYRREQHEGRSAVAARADNSASMWRRRVTRASDALGDVEFSWWVLSVPPDADVSHAEYGDAPARVLFAFSGDTRSLSPRDQLMFDLAQALTGEAPPFATLVYVWDAKAPVGTVIVHPRSDRVRKIVVESGTGGLRQWRHYRRNLAADYLLAFGDAPGPLEAMAVMTDGDNTRSQLRTWYGDIEFR